MNGDGWLWPMGGMMMVGWLFLALLVIGTALLATSYGRRPKPDAQDSARRILAERYARGEIDTDEYEQRLGALR